VLIWAFGRFERRSIDAEGVGLRASPSAAPLGFPATLALVVGAAAVGLSLLVGSSAGNASAYGTVDHVGVGLALAELLVRYPATVLAEEAFFRGWLQPRLGRDGPVIAAVLWGLYHLQQIATIPSIIVFGLILGWIRWRTQTIRITGLMHYLSNAIFFITNYL